MELKSLKQSLRKESLLLSRNYSDEVLRDYSSQIFQSLSQTQAFKEAEYVLGYYSFGKEVFTHDFIEKYMHEKKIILPVVTKEKLILKEYCKKDQLRLSDYGILEPTGPDFTDYLKIDLGIIPGVVFDRNMNRLGRGKGYYDKLLPQLTNTHLIGVCFSFQLKDCMHVESHDHPMDLIITQNEIIK